MKPRAGKHSASAQRAHVGVVSTFKVPRDRNVKSSAVPCPYCKAGVGEACRKRDGTPGTNVHRRRRGLAIEMGY